MMRVVLAVAGISYAMMAGYDIEDPTAYISTIAEYEENPMEATRRWVFTPQS